MATTRPTPFHERRRCRRRPAVRRTIVSCLRGTMGLGRDIGVRLHDFSEEGLRLVVSAELSPGEEVEVAVSPVGQSQAVSAAGKVVWSAPTEGGFWAGIKLDRRLTYQQLQLLT
jgi:lipid-binding SYLF domain-containing protein